MKAGQEAMQQRPNVFSPTCAHLLWAMTSPCFFETQGRAKLQKSRQIQNVGYRCAVASDT